MSETCLVSPRSLWYASRRLWWSSYWGLKVEGIRNVPTDRPVLLCGNHVSHLDAPAILAALPRSVSLRVHTAAAKDVFADHPLYDMLGRLTTNSVPIERNAGFSRGLRHLEGILRAGFPLILFPEGRRSPDGSLLKFHRGAALLSVHTGVPIIPVHLRGMHAVLPRGRVLPSPARVRVRFGSPLPPGSYRGEDRSQTYHRMTDALRTSVKQLAID